MLRRARQHGIFTTKLRTQSEQLLLVILHQIPMLQEISVGHGRNLESPTAIDDVFGNGLEHVAADVVGQVGGGREVLAAQVGAVGEGQQQVVPALGQQHVVFEQRFAERHPATVDQDGHLHEAAQQLAFADAAGHQLH